MGSWRLQWSASLETRGDLYHDDSQVSDVFHVSIRRFAMTLDVGYQAGEQVRLDLSIPWLDHIANFGTGAGRRHVNQSGLGDIALTAAWYPWAPPAEEGHEHSFFEAHHVNLVFGMKLPTGEETEEVARTMFAAEGQTGSGTLDLITQSDCFGLEG